MMKKTKKVSITNLKRKGIKILDRKRSIRIAGGSGNTNPYQGLHRFFDQ